MACYAEGAEADRRSYGQTREETVRTRLIAFTAFLVLLVSPAALLAQRSFTLDDAMGVRRVVDPRLSPDGSQVVYTVSEVHADTNTRPADLWLVPAAGGPARQLTFLPANDTHPRWSPDGRAIAFLSDRDGVDESGKPAGRRAQVWLLDTGGGEARQVTRSATPVTDFAWSPDGRALVYVANAQPADHEAREARRKAGFDEVVVGDHRMSHLWTIEIATGTSSQVTSGPFHATEPAWSPKGDLIAFVSRPTPVANESLLSDLFVVSPDGVAPRRLIENDGPDFAPAWSPDGREIAYLSNARRQSSAAINAIMGVAVSGGPPRTVTQGFEYTAGEPRWSPDGTTIYFSTGVRTESHLFAVPAAGGPVRALTTGAFVHGGLDVARTGQQLVFLREDARAPADVWVSAADGSAARRLTTANPQIADLRLARTEVVQWKAPDGWDIEGVLVYPADYQAGTRAPLIVEPHGGPHGRQAVGFDPDWQYYAAHGFMVFAPNFRGSGNYPQEFIDADRNDWGGGDYLDIMSGVDHLIALGLADPDRMGVEGWSYGGYMTSWIIGHTDRFKAAVPGAAVTNLHSFYGTTDIQRFIEWEFSGFPWDNAQKIRDHSPITFAPRAKTPTLVLHGEADVRVPLEQGQQLYTTLKKAGVTVEMVIYPREGHGFREPAHVRDRLRRTLEWMERYVGR